MKQISEQDFNTIIIKDFEKYINEFNTGYIKARIKNGFIELFKDSLQAKAREFENKFPVIQERYLIVKNYELDNSFNNFFQAIINFSKQSEKNLEILIKGSAHQMAITLVWKEIFNPDTDINAFPIEIREYKINSQRKPVIQFFNLDDIEGIKHEKNYNDIKLQNIFTEINNYDVCINALRTVNPPVIDNANNYLLGEREKGAIVAWIEVLKKRGKIKTIERNELAEILNNSILGLEISSRTLGNIKTTACNKYFSKLTSLIK